jgi:hypothetical protein
MLRTYLKILVEHQPGNFSDLNAGHAAQYAHSLGKVFSAIGELGNNFLNQAFDTGPKRRLLGRLKALRDKGGEVLLRQGEPVADIDVIGDVEYAMPLEYICLDWEEIWCNRMNSETCPQVGDLPAISRCAMGFLGFTFNLRRIPLKEGAFSPQKLLTMPIQSDDRLGVRFYPYDGLQTIHEERAFFAEENVHGFCLSAIKLGGNVKSATRHVGKSLGAALRPPVHHFACHFSPGSGDKQDAFFRLGSKSKCFDVPLYGIPAFRSTRLRKNWLVFLNACETGSTVSFRRGGLVSLLLHTFKAKCVIGPELKVPDAFASEFAKVFYAYWLRHQDIGLALFKARWFFLLHNRKSVPLGLFYVCFAAQPIRLAGKPVHVFL